MKQFRKVLMVMVVALVGSLSAKAMDYDFVVDGNYFKIISAEDLTCAIMSSDTRTGELVIPSNVVYKNKTFTVTSIGMMAFYFFNEITSVEIPNTIQEIVNGAFSNCSNLGAVTIPNSVVKIVGAFDGCTSLKTLKLGNSLQQIGGFSNCDGLSSVDFPDSVEEIDGFDGCDILNSVHLGNSVKTIGWSAFSDCPRLETINFPKSLSTIGREAFHKCAIKDFTCDNEDLVNYFVSTRIYEIKRLTLLQNIKEIKCRISDFGAGLEELHVLATNPPTFTQSSPVSSSQFVNTTLFVPKESIEVYKADEVWGKFWEIETEESSAGTEKCGAPSISVVDGKLVVTSQTEGAVCHTNIMSEDIKEFTTNSNEAISLQGQYLIKSYASAPGYNNSETIEATLVWVNPSIYDANNIISMEAKKAVVIRKEGNGIVVCGTERGEIVELYSLDGKLLQKQTAQDGETMISRGIQKGNAYIVRYGEKSVKIKI